MTEALTLIALLLFLVLWAWMRHARRQRRCRLYVELVFGEPRKLKS